MKKDIENSIEYIQNDINNDADILDLDYILDNNLIENKMLNLIENDNQDIYKISTTQFNYYFRKASKPFFYRTHVLKCNNNYNIYKDKMIVNNNAVVDWYKIKSLFNYYIDICDKYNKYVLLYNFIDVTYIHSHDFYNEYKIQDNKYLSDEGMKVLEEFNSIRLFIMQKIPEKQENIIESKLADNHNITGAIAIANKKFGYSQNNNNAPQIINNYINSQALPNFGNNSPKIEQNKQ